MEQLREPVHVRGAAHFQRAWQFVRRYRRSTIGGALLILVAPNVVGALLATSVEFGTDRIVTVGSHVLHGVGVSALKALQRVVSGWIYYEHRAAEIFYEFLTFGALRRTWFGDTAPSSVDAPNQPASVLSPPADPPTDQPSLYEQFQYIYLIFLGAIMSYTDGTTYGQ